jgi:isoquinoline 1-oxidoreductase alpha subunit
MRLEVNGDEKQVEVDPQMPLLWVLRDELGITGPKFGCGMSLCGACTVHIDGVPTRSCTMPVSAVSGKVVTIEGIKQGDGTLHAVQQAWQKHQVAQCGYCQPGQIMAAVALLTQAPNPSDEQIHASMSNLCRCGTYPRIKLAIQTAAALLQSRAKENKKGE